MNILLINHYAGSPYHGMEYRPYYLGCIWQRYGHKLRIIAASYSHLRAVQPRVESKIASETIEGLQYFWIRTPPYRGNGFSRIRNMVAFIKGLFTNAVRLTRDIKPDVVIASSTYPLDIFPAWFLAKRYKAQLIFEVHDLWPLSPIELGGFSRWHPFIMVMQIAENFAYRHADKVVSMLPKAEAHMRSHGLAPGKFVYVPNGANLEEHKDAREPLPDTLRTLLHALKTNGRFIVCYTGSHGIANALDTLLEAAAITIREPISYILVGNGPEKARLMAMANERELANVEFCDAIPKRAIHPLLSEADVLVLSWKRQPLYRFGVSPNKLVDYMIAGKPIVMAIGAGNDLVSEAGCGFTIPPECPEELAKALRKMRALTPNERELLGKRGRAYVATHFDYNVLAKKFVHALCNEK